MYYETMPLYPAMRGECDRKACVRVPIFEDGRRPGSLEDEVRPCERVTIENPCRPGERAEVLLGLDGCGNLVVCVRRDRRAEDDCAPCRPNRRRPRCVPEPCVPPPRRCCERGRLYGTWR